MLIWVLLFCTCNTSKKLKLHSSFEVKEVPNGLYLNDTLIIDRTEINNLYYKEFLHHQSQLHGIDSEEVLSLLPDKSLRIDLIGKEKDELPIDDYLAEYDLFPVVGLDLRQAQEYSNWRSNAVFQLYLFESGIIEFDHEKTETKSFTISQYLASENAKKYKDIVTHYPHFFIPEKRHWDIVIDKLKDNSIKPYKEFTTKNEINIEAQSKVPFSYVDPIALEKNKKKIFNILDNVSEMVNQKNIVFVGNHEDNKVDSLVAKFKTVSIPNEKVGFRNFCRWVKIDYDN